MVSIESGRSLGGGFDAPDQLATKARNENFPVASRLLPSDVRANLMAIYGFARLADDLGDEAEGDRLALLDWLETELDRAAAANATHPVLKQLTPVIRGLDLSLDPFRCLIEANRVDQRVTRYQSFDDLVGLLHAVCSAGGPACAGGVRCLDGRADRAFGQGLHRLAGCRAPSRHRRGREARPHLSAGRGHGALRVQRN